MVSDGNLGRAIFAIIVLMAGAGEATAQSASAWPDAWRHDPQHWFVGLVPAGECVPAETFANARTPEEVATALRGAGHEFSVSHQNEHSAFLSKVPSGGGLPLVRGFDLCMTMVKNARSHGIGVQ